MSDPATQVEHLNAMENLAELTGAYYQGLVAHGFTVEQAMELTHTWLASTIGASGGTDDD